MAMNLGSEWPLDLLRGMVRIYSPSGREGELAAFLAREMARAGWRARVDEAGNFVGELGAAAPGAKQLVFLGHIDTVKGEIPVREENGVLYGRGAVDAKGPLAAFLVAATRLASRGELPASLRLTCIGAVEEETNTSRGARHVIPLHRPDFLIVGEPSGWDAICIGYKGNCHTRLRIEQPRTHGASGVDSAPTRACRFWQALVEQAARQSAGERTIDRVTVNVRAMESDSDGLTERAAMTFDIRTPPGFDAATFKAALAAATPAGATLEYLEECPPVRASKSGPLVHALRKAIRAEGAEARFLFKTATSDMNIAGPAWNCPMVAYGPGDSSLDHTPQEHIALDEFIRSARVLEAALKGLGGAAS